MSKPRTISDYPNRAEDYETAVSKMHDQNTDIALDEGGGNEVSAEEIRTHIDSRENPHGVTAEQVGAYTKGETRGFVAIPVPALPELMQVDPSEFGKALVSGFYVEGDIDKAVVWIWQASRQKSDHNGWSCINPGHLSEIGTPGWYDPTGDNTDDSGNGVWVREVVFRSMKVTELGAKGDGSHYDNYAIQAGIDSISGNSLATLVFPSGHYMINEPIELSDRLALIGEGGAIIETTASTPCVRSFYKEYLTLERLNFRAPNTTSICVFGVSQNVAIRNCIFEHDEQAESNNVAGIRFGAQSGSSRFQEVKNVWIEGCSFRTVGVDVLCQPDGTSPDGISDVFVRGNKIDCSIKRTEGNADCLKFDGNGYAGSGYVVSDNIIDINGQAIGSGINFEEGVWDLTVVNNIIKNGVCSAGIFFFHGQKNVPTHNMTIANNTIYNAGGKSTSRAIQISNAASFTAVNIVGNNIRDFDGVGIYLWNVIVATITGNTLYNIIGDEGEGAAFFLRSVSDLAMSGNSIRNAPSKSDLWNCSNAVISANTFRDSERLQINGGSNISFSDNSCIDNIGVSNLGWLQVSAGSTTGLIISNNRIKTTHESAVFVGTGQSQIRILDNDFESAGAILNAADMGVIVYKPLID